MSELINPREPMYPGGEMTVHEWYRLEGEVDTTLPDFEHPQVPVVPINVPNIGKVNLHHFNTTIVKYEGDWEKMSHIVIERNDKDPIFFFRNLETTDGQPDKWLELAELLLERDFNLTVPPERPAPYVFEMYWKGIRGNQTIEHIIGRIINESC